MQSKSMISNPNLYEIVIFCKKIIDDNSLMFVIDLAGRLIIFFLSP